MPFQVRRIVAYANWQTLAVLGGVPARWAMVTAKLANMPDGGDYRPDALDGGGCAEAEWTHQRAALAILGAFQRRRSTSEEGTGQVSAQAAKPLRYSPARLAKDASVY